MKCSVIQQKLSACLDGELEDSQNFLVESHLKTCQTCATEFEKLKKMDALLDDGVRLRPHPYLLTRVKASVRASLEKQTRPLWAFLHKGLAPAFVVAGLLLGIVIGLQLNDNLPSRATTEQSADYSIIDANFVEPLPSGSITATYVGLVNSMQ
ncbi:zf-HC2 domain-containing protein [candidate division KSB1 bacterium]|nr:zf-HC2 domain-containing protein [candidate division KSB1 bacterium]